MKNAFREMACAKQMTCEISVLFPPETATFLKAGGQLKPASQPQLLNLRILIKRETEESQLAGLVQAG